MTYCLSTVTLNHAASGRLPEFPRCLGKFGWPVPKRSPVLLTESRERKITFNFYLQVLHARFAGKNKIFKPTNIVFKSYSLSQNYSNNRIIIKKKKKKKRKKKTLIREK
ncbi:hypothetical protein PUN28_007027 [Cardiocondyla obscurior]|uniref:Uncharacterized protein n=1 Tax=Cardiocondyla obscurior TaxID=286306 RepID=A0AAW2G671_9HYME